MHKTEVLPVGISEEFEKALPPHYRVVELIGRGGMSEVYRARDERLDRWVAIKILNSTMRSDGERIRRFAQEARAVSSLNHPNILTIHDVGEADGHQYIVTEFVEGESLAARLSRGKFTVNEAIDNAIQIASALTAAHRAGIVHRDIKPENIMIRRDGTLKVLDFGLAKDNVPRNDDVDFQAVTLARALTSPGLILGTPQYMSPEQARGKELDQRTDIFSLGIVFFEMLTGRPPFSGPTVVDTIAAIIGSEPKRIEEFLVDPPLSLIRIIERSLRKDRAERYQAVAPMLDDLTALRKELSSTHDLKHPTAEHQPRRTLQNTLSAISTKYIRWDKIVAVPILSALVVGGWFYMRSGTAETAATASSRIYRSSGIANWSSDVGELENSASFSPDAKTVAYAAVRSGASEIWIKPVEGGDSVQVTKEGFYNQDPRWSPDGREIAYASKRGADLGIWRSNFLGGAQLQIAGSLRPDARLLRWGDSGKVYLSQGNELYQVDGTNPDPVKLTDFGAHGLAPRVIEVAPDERQIAYSGLVDGVWKIFVRPIDGGTPVEIASSPQELDKIAWKPDSSAIAFSQFTDGTYQAFIVGSRGGEPVQISNGDEDVLVEDVSSRSTILYRSTNESTDLWKLADGKEEMVANSTELELWPSISPDGQSVAFQTDKSSEVPINGAITFRSLAEGGTSKNIAQHGFDPAVSPDGQFVTYFVTVPGKQSLWRANITGGEAKQLAEGVSTAGYTVTPYLKIAAADKAWAPDGRSVAYVRRPDGVSNIYTVSTDGTDEKQLSSNSDPNTICTSPFWTPEGSLVYQSFTNTGISSRPAVNRIWLKSADGGAKEIYSTSDRVRLLGVVDRGTSIVIAQKRWDGPSATRDDGEVTLYKVSTADGRATAFATLPGAYMYNTHLSRDAKLVAFTSRRDGNTLISSVSVSGGPVKVLYEENDPKVAISTLALSSDGRTMVYGKQTRNSLLSLLTK